MNNDYLVLYNPRKSVIPDGWDLVRIGDHGKLVAGGTPSTRKYEYWENGDVPWMRSGDIHQKRITYVEGKITRKGLENSSATLLPVDSVLIALAGQGKTRGTVAINEISLSTNQSVAAIIPDNLIDFEFLYYILDARYEILRRLSTGDGGRGGLNLSILRNIWLAIPPLLQQKRISEILRTWDEAIAKTEGLITALEKRKKGLMQRLLTGQVRFPGFTDEWRELRLTDILQDDKSSIKVGPFGSQLKKAELVDNGYKVFGQENIYQNRFDIGDRYITEEKFIKLKTCEILPGDFLISMMGTVGKSSIVPNRFQRGIMDSHLIRLRLNKNIYNNQFLRYLFQSYYIEKQVRRLSVGGIMEGLSSKIVKQIKLPLTSIDEQKLISNLLEVGDKHINLMIERKEFLLLQKKGLMQRLLTGHVRVNVDD